MTTFRSVPGILGVACALLLGGCSTRSGGSDAGHARPSNQSHSTGIRLAPDPAYASAQLTVVFDDPMMKAAPCKFQWRRNGAPISGAETNALDPGQFASGDEVAVTVTVPDAAGDTRTMQAQLRVGGSVPQITRATILSGNGNDGPVLNATAESVDPDGRTPVYEYAWYRNGTKIEGAAGPSLPVSALQRGDQVVVEVVARDDAGASLPMRSEPFAVSDHPPQISSQPLEPRVTDTAFQYQAAGMDPDGDALHFELVQGPVGMSMDPGGLLSWTFPTGADRAGDFPVSIRATDKKGGQATQDFTIHLDAPPAAPTKKPATQAASTPPATGTAAH